MLLEKPSFAAKFDVAYGVGTAAAILEENGIDPNASPEPKPKKKKEPSAKHVAMLLENPSFAPKFDVAYGEGTADRILAEHGVTVAVEEETEEEQEEEEEDNAVEETAEEQDAAELKRIEQMNNALGDEIAEQLAEIEGEGAKAAALEEKQEQEKEAAEEQEKAAEDKESAKERAKEKAKSDFARERAVSSASKSDAIKAVQAAESPTAPVQSPTSAGSPKPKKPKKAPSEKHIQMLLDKPSFSSKFDQAYGEGAADAILVERGAATAGGVDDDDDEPEPEPEDQVIASSEEPPTMESPPGVPALALSTSPVVTSPDEERRGYTATSPTSPKSKKKKPSGKHIDMLLANPSFAPKFDIAYGEGAAEAILGQRQTDQEEEAEVEAEAEAGAGAEVPEVPVDKPKKEPKQKHIDMLLENPSFAPKFDQAYGAGVAVTILAEHGIELPPLSEEDEEEEYAEEEQQGEDRPVTRERGLSRLGVDASSPHHDEDIERLAARLAQLNNVLHMEQESILRMPRKDRKAAKQRIADVELRIGEMSLVLQTMHRDKEKAELRGPPPAHRLKPKPLPIEEEEEEGQTGGGVDEEEEGEGPTGGNIDDLPTEDYVDDDEEEEEEEEEEQPEPEVPATPKTPLHKKKTLRAVQEVVHEPHKQDQIHRREVQEVVHAPHKEDDRPAFLGRYVFEASRPRYGVKHGEREIWVAEDKRLECKKVDVKILSDDKALRRELKIRKELKGAGMSSIVDLIRTHVPGKATGAEAPPEHTFVCVLPCMETTLAEAMFNEELAGANVEEILRVSQSVASAVGHLHTLGIVHGDLRPRNIARVDGEWLLSDLSHASHAGDDVSVGKAEAYLPPEVMALVLPSWGNTDAAATSPRGRSPTHVSCEASPTHDIWSLGVVLYELCTGSPLFNRVLIDESLVEVSDVISLASWQRLSPELMERVLHHARKFNQCTRARQALAMDLIGLLLQGDPEQRPTAPVEIMSHPFFESREPELASITTHTPVYLSYTRDAEGFAQRLKGGLLSMGVHCLEHEKNGIKTAKVIIPILSQGYLRSAVCAEEATLAQEAGLPFVTAMADAPGYDEASSAEDISPGEARLRLMMNDANGSFDGFQEDYWGSLVRFGGHILPLIERESALHAIILSTGNDYAFAQDLTADLKAYGVTVTVKASADQWMSFEWKDALKDANVMIAVVSNEFVGSSAAFQLLRAAEDDPTVAVISVMMTPDVLDPATCGKSRTGPYMSGMLRHAPCVDFGDDSAATMEDLMAEMRAEVSLDRSEEGMLRARVERYSRVWSVGHIPKIPARGDFEEKRDMEILKQALVAEDIRQERKKRPRVLLCYDDADKPAGRKILSFLMTLPGVEVGELTCEPKKWYGECQGDCGVVIPLLSEAFVRSRKCEGMMRFAEDSDVKVIQVVVDASGFGDVMGAISAMHSTSTAGSAEVRCPRLTPGDPFTFDCVGVTAGGQGEKRHD